MAVGMVSVKAFLSIGYVLSCEWEVVTGWDLLIIGPSIIMKFYQGMQKMGMWTSGPKASVVGGIRF